jgi:hypothetical protein
MFRMMCFLSVLLISCGLTACSHQIPKPGGLVMQTSNAKYIVSPPN